MKNHNKKKDKKKELIVTPHNEDEVRSVHLGDEAQGDVELPFGANEPRNVRNRNNNIDYENENDVAMDNDEEEEAKGENSESSDSDDDDDDDDDEDDESEQETENEEEEDVGEPQNKKRAHDSEDQQDDADEEQPRRKSKKSNKDLFKPPTAEEITYLRETEDLYKSNLFRLQMSLIIENIKVPDACDMPFKNWFAKLEKLLLNLKKLPKTEMTDLKYFEDNDVKPPLNVTIKTESFQFLPPSKLHLVGAFPSKCSLYSGTSPPLLVDIAVEMPDECLSANDYKNHIYHQKQSLYLSYIAVALQKFKLVKVLGYSLIENYYLKSALFLKPDTSDPIMKHIFVRIIAICSSERYNLSDLSPNINNIEDKCTKNGESCSPTPVYNRTIVFDMMIKNSDELIKQHVANYPSVQDAIILLKLWVTQRQLNTGFGSFTGFILTMFIIYLIKNRRINPLMSSYQIIRNAWIALSQSDWTTKGISLGNGENIDIFHESDDVVFLDPSGYLNYCGHMSKYTFITVKDESARALACLDNPNINSFDALFINKLDFFLQYDHCIIPRDCDVFDKMERKYRNHQWKKDGNLFWKVQDKVIDLLYKCLGTRVKQISYYRGEHNYWQINSSCRVGKGNIPWIICLTLDPENALKLVDKGPISNTEEAKVFRKFWGYKCETRRFKDGTISEAVVWKKRPIADRRTICRDIVNYVLRMHLGLPSDNYLYIADQEEIVLHNSLREEGLIAVTKSADELTRILTQLEGLPLAISSVQGTSPCLRYTEPFPPYPFKIKSNDEESVCIKASSLRFIKHLAPITLVATLGLSNKWPEDLDAIKRIKAAFYLKIAELIKEQANIIAQANPEWVDISKDGFVFRVIIYHAREISLLKEIKTPQGQISYKDNEKSLKLELETYYLPKVSASLHGLQMTNSAFGPACCLAKRWIASHQILGESQIPEIAVELMMATLFLNPEPFKAPNQPQVAFLRFICLCAFTDLSQGFFVNFNNEIPKQELWELQKKIRDNRKVALPIVTPDAKSGDRFTKNFPDQVLVHHLKKVAQDCYKHLSENIRQNAEWKPREIFQPNFSKFDVIIDLDSRFIKLHEHVNYDAEYKVIIDTKETKNIPVVGLDIVGRYITELKDAFNEYCGIFYDIYGGDRIGIIMKPTINNLMEFKVARIGCREPAGNLNPTCTEFSIRQFVDDLTIMGEGLVSAVRVLNPEMSYKLGLNLDGE